MVLRSAQTLLAILFFFVHVACVQTPIERAERAQIQAQAKAQAQAKRELASVYQSLADQCKALLISNPAKQFDFEQFCKTRDQIAAGEQLTLENWQQKPAEELMAIIEAFSMAAFGSGQQLEQENISKSQARKLKAQIVKLQKSKKNQDEKIRALVAYWYRLTHEKSAYKLLKNNAKSVEGLFIKISEEKRIQRIEAELAKRGVIEAFQSVGFTGNTTYWQKFKNYLEKKRNEKNLIIAALFTIPAVTQSDLLMAFFPVWDFAKTEKLADRYQEIAYESGHDKAHEMIRQESRRKGTFDTYAKMLSHTVNTAFFAALIVHGVQYFQFEADAQAGAIEIIQSTDSAEDQNKAYYDKMTNEIIKAKEKDLDRSLTSTEKQKIRDDFYKLMQAANSQASVTK